MRDATALQISENSEIQHIKQIFPCWPPVYCAPQQILHYRRLLRSPTTQPVNQDVRRRAGVRMFWAVAAFGAATVVFGLSQNMWLSVLALAVLGAADMISVYVRQTLVQIVTPDHMRGRVSSVSGLFISGSNELGEFESGVVSRFIGPVAACVAGGIGTIGVTGLWAWMFPALRKVDTLSG